jgi:hypothetical protein
MRSSCPPQLMQNRIKGMCSLSLKTRSGRHLGYEPPVTQIAGAESLSRHPFAVDRRAFYGLQAQGSASTLKRLGLAQRPSRALRGELLLGVERPHP